MMPALATNSSFTKTATVSADNFVDFKRKVAMELGLTGWMKVVVHKGRNPAGLGLISVFLKIHRLNF